MAKKKRRRRPAGRPAAPRPAQEAASKPAAPARPPSEASAVRRERKEEARQARQAALRRLRRQRMFRRVGIWAVGGVAVIVAYTLITAGGHKINEQLRRRAEAIANRVGCSQIIRPEGNAPGGQHLPSENSPYTYTQNPPTSGFHAPSPYPPDPHVYSDPVQQTIAVHNLEHGYIWFYYRADGTGALPGDVINALETLANAQDKVKMAPYPTLDEGRALALAGWNRLQQCPATIDAQEARTVALSFIDQFRSDGEAPEPNL